MKTNLQLEWTDYLAALRLNGRPSLSTAIIFAVGLVFVGLGTLIGLTLALRGDSDLLLQMVPVYLVIGFIVLAYFFLAPFNAKRLFNQTAELKDPQGIEVTPEGLRHTTPLSQALRPWASFVKWKEDKHLLLLYISSFQFVMLPKRTVPEALLAQVRTYLQALPRPPQRPWWQTWRVRSCLIYVLIVIAIVVLLFQFRAQTH